MWTQLGQSLRKLNVWWYHHRIKGALALHRRGEVRSDGLTVASVCNRLAIGWRARDVHPWDRDLPPHQKETEFAKQVLADTEAAILRIFETLPEIDVIELRVIEPNSDALIAAGTIQRATLNTSRPQLLSVGMRLRELGVEYRFAAHEKGPSSTCDSAGELSVG
jgi:hypothetical protein